MLRALLSGLRFNTSNDQQRTRRNYPRRECDRCVVVVENKTFPIEDWSPAGILLDADDRLFTINQEIELTIKFKLRDKVLDVTHKGRVVRKGNNKVAVEFKPLPQRVRHTFQQIIDDHVAEQFAASQAG